MSSDQDVYQKNYYESDGYGGEEVKNLYAYEDADDGVDDDADGYGSVDAESSGDELLAIPSNGYSEAADFTEDVTEEEAPQVGYSYGIHPDAEGDNYHSVDLPPVHDAQNVNLKCVIFINNMLLMH